MASMNVVLEVSESTLSFAAGYLAGSMDRRLGTGTRWTIRVYMDLIKAPPTIEYVNRLELEIAQAWPGPGLPPRLKDVL